MFLLKDAKILIGCVFNVSLGVCINNGILMRSNRLLSIFGCCLLLYSCTGIRQSITFNNQPVEYVDPLIGSGGHGHVFVGTSVPHGMIQLGPDNLSMGWDWCSGYHDSDSTIIGFAHTHLSGTGIADLGDILFMPLTGVPKLSKGTPEHLINGYVSTFDKRNQIVRPGYYSVLLNKYNIKAELTSTERVGFHKYSYPEGEKAFVLIDLNEGVKSLEARKGTVSSGFRLINDSTIAGYRISDEWAKDHRVYFTSIFSRPILKCEVYKEELLMDSVSVSGKDVKAILRFADDKAPLLVKTGISYVSEQGAANNIISELPGWDFETVKNTAADKWNQSLSKIEFQSKDPSVMKIFYTSLYHTLIAPSLFSDADGRYRGADGKIYRADGFTPFTVFSLWDTYRAVHPLYTLIDNNVSDYANTLLAINDQQKSMPVWSLVGNETNCMVGIHSIPVVVDACLKGFSVDKERAFQAVRRIKSMDENGLKYVRENGYIPADKELWSVARGLEYAIDDYSVAQLANALNKEDEYKTFLERSKNYKNYFDRASGFMRGKMSNGLWRSNFDPFHSVHMEDDYIEGNAWQYTWLVPHDVQGLITQFGGKEKFLNKLDSLFVVSSELNEGASVDISGMIGQYAHGNEPSHHILYLYPYAGEQWKTAGLVRKVFNQFYKTTPDGLIGNEDCGQMSAWYIFSALGFYPVNPVNGVFVFGSPLADSAKINLNNGKIFEIVAENNSPENIYIQSVTLNNKAYTNSYITYTDIMKGGRLTFIMGKTPDKSRIHMNNNIPEYATP